MAQTTKSVLLSHEIERTESAIASLQCDIAAGRSSSTIDQLFFNIDDFVRVLALSVIKFLVMFCFCLRKAEKKLAGAHDIDEKLDKKMKALQTEKTCQEVELMNCQSILTALQTHLRQNLISVNIFAI
jgi:hypothetical protein